MKFGFCMLILALVMMETFGNESGDAELLKSGSNKFTAEMFSEVAKNNINKSFVISAFSVLTPLALLSQASEGSSHDELLRAIGLPDDKSVKSVFSYMNNKFRSVKGVELKMANKIYVANGYTLNDEYAAVSRQTFQSEVKSVDFNKNVKTANEINSWVEDQTNNRIKDLVDPSSLTADTRAVLVNAIYFKGTWRQPFNKMLTHDRNFYVSSGKTTKVPMMYRKGNFNYGVSNELDAKILEIGYEGDESAFYIVLPNKVDGINELKDKLRNPSTLDKALDNMYDVEVEAYIPKFKIETTTNLKQVLPKIGVKQIFDASKANLNKLLKESSDLYISDAVQKAFIEINEEGAEAAAANAFIIAESLSLGLETLFVADRPFYFEIRSRKIAIFNGVYSPK